MSASVQTPPRKWRPSLATVTLAIVGTVLVLPFAGIGFLRLAENHLVRATEAELIAQGSAIAAAMSARLGEAEPRPALGPVVPKPEADAAGEDKRWNPVLPTLDLATSTVLPSRPDARPVETAIGPAYRSVGEWLDPILVATQQATLAGFRVTDPAGTVIAGREDTGLSLAHLPELALALEGRPASALRTRVVDNPQPIQSISRGTAIRVFVALPVVLDGRVAGAVYASRTPSNVIKELYAQRWRLGLAALLIIAAAALLGFVLLRTVVRPVRELTRRTRRIAGGDREAIQPLGYNGTRELFELSSGMLAMSRRIVDRSDTLSTFATHVSHELKSPLAAIRGAVELLGDPDLSPEHRAHFQRNVERDVDRMALLLDRLREMSRTEALDLRGHSDLHSSVAEATDALALTATIAPAHSRTTLPLSAEAAGIVFSNLAENAAQHGASELRVRASRANGAIVIDVADNGSGISAGNRAHVFELFHTTRRETGGTGMGLSIVRSVLRAVDGTITLLNTDATEGTAFRIVLPEG